MDIWDSMLSALHAARAEILWKSFVKQIIDTFKEQRVGHQFAVVVYCSQRDLDSGFRSVQFITQDKYGLPLISSDIVCVPKYIAHITNYLAARPEYKEGYIATKPEDKVHAEEILVNNLDRLTIAYIKHYQELPKHIFIYTWFTPCSTCSQLIIDKLCSPVYDEIPTTVLYTANTPVKGDNVAHARQTLIDAGFEVQQVPYDCYLPVRHQAVAST